MAAYGNASVAAAPTTTMDATNYAVTTVHDEYGAAAIASMGGEPPPKLPKAYILTGDGWEPVTAPNF